MSFSAARVEIATDPNIVNERLRRRLQLQRSQDTAKARDGLGGAKL